MRRWPTKIPSNRQYQSPGSSEPQMHSPFDTPTVPDCGPPPAPLEPPRHNPRGYKGVMQAPTLPLSTCFRSAFLTIACRVCAPFPAGLSPDRKKEIQPMRGKFTQMMSWSRLHDLAGLRVARAIPYKTMRRNSHADAVCAHDPPQPADGRHETVPIRSGFADARAKTPLNAGYHACARRDDRPAADLCRRLRPCARAGAGEDLQCRRGAAERAWSNG